MIKKILLVSVVSSMLITLTGCVKIVKTGEEDNLKGIVEFNAGDNVAEIWESQAIPNLTEKAVDLNQFFDESNGNLNSLADKYGKYSMGDSGELSYVIKSTLTINEVVTDKKAGYLIASLDDYDGSIQIKIQIGSIYKGSAVRDSLDFIKFEDYRNQVDYAAVSQSIHDLIQKNLINNLDIESLNGKEILLTGCFTVDKENEILITPVLLEIL